MYTIKKNSSQLKLRSMPKNLILLIYTTIISLSVYLNSSIPSFGGMFSVPLRGDYLRCNSFMVLEATAFVAFFRMLSMFFIDVSKNKNVNLIKQNIKTRVKNSIVLIKTMNNYAALFLVMSVAKYGVSLVYDHNLWLGYIFMIIIPLFLVFFFLVAFYGIIFKNEYCRSLGWLFASIPLLLMYVSPSLSIIESFISLVVLNTVGYIAIHFENIKKPLI